MPRKRSTLGQGSIYQRNGWWWCDFSVDGVRRREACDTKDRDEALAYLHRRQGNWLRASSWRLIEFAFAICLVCFSTTTTCGRSRKLTSRA